MPLRPEAIYIFSQPSADNFNQTVSTRNIVSTSIELKLNHWKQVDKQHKIEELFFNLNTKAVSLIKRICSMLQNIYSKTENISRAVIETFQKILTSINLMKGVS